MESYKIPNFMILGTKNAPGGLKTDIGGPCPKPYINITFWGDFFSPGGGKTSFGVEKCDLGGNFDFFCFGAIRVILGGSETSIFL